MNVSLQRFTQTMRLERLSREQGTMDEAPSQSEAEKKLSTKVFEISEGFSAQVTFY